MTVLSHFPGTLPSRLGSPCLYIMLIPPTSGRTPPPLLSILRLQRGVLEPRESHLVASSRLDWAPEVPSGRTGAQSCQPATGAFRSGNSFFQAQEGTAGASSGQASNHGPAQVTSDDPHQAWPLREALPGRGGGAGAQDTATEAGRASRSCVSRLSPVPQSPIRVIPDY